MKLNSGFCNIQALQRSNVQGCSETQGHRLGKQGDSYLLGNGVANDDVAFWDVPGHSGRVGSEVSDVTFTGEGGRSGGARVLTG